jgi:hypothetical protein
MPTELTLAQQTALVQALRQRLLAGRPQAAVALFETHISWVLVDGGQAWKIKKALRLDFLGYASLALRRQAGDEELRLNRRLAPSMYLGLVGITGSLAAPVLDGPGPVLDWAVHMRAFAQCDQWDNMAQRGALLPAQVDELVALLLPFHERAAVARADQGVGDPDAVRQAQRDNLDSLATLLPQADQPALQTLRTWEASCWPALVPVMAQRLAAGRVRECHGDLHLGNVAQLDGRVTPFDGIEFNAAFRWIDVINELAFMAMDLQAHGLPALSHRLVNAYLEATGDDGGLRVLRYYLVYRALVRAKVAALRQAQAPDMAKKNAASAHHYLMLALLYTQAAPPALIITHGLSGSGKTTLTQDLLERLGAVRFRSDLERKRIAGVAPHVHGDPAALVALYSPSQSAATYARLFELAGAALASGWPVILDAAFLQRAQRQAAGALAASQGVPLLVLALEADPATLRARLRQRSAQGGDASDADERVLAAQMHSMQPLAEDEPGTVFHCASGQTEGAALLGRRARTPHFSGIGVPRSTATAVTEFCGEPSIKRSE